jgi:hypothetical protein
VAKIMRLRPPPTRERIRARLGQYLLCLRDGGTVEVVDPHRPLSFRNEADFRNWLWGRFLRPRELTGKAPPPPLAEDSLDDPTTRPPN